MTVKNKPWIVSEKQIKQEHVLLSEILPSIKKKVVQGLTRMFSSGHSIFPPFKGVPDDERSFVSGPSTIQSKNNKDNKEYVRWPNYRQGQMYFPENMNGGNETLLSRPIVPSLKSKNAMVIFTSSISEPGITPSLFNQAGCDASGKVIFAPLKENQKKETAGKNGEYLFSDNMATDILSEE